MAVIGSWKAVKVRRPVITFFRIALWYGWEIGWVAY